MTTARSIISGAMRFHLNRLSPGETLNDDDADVALEALNHIADEFNGQKAFLFREILTSGTVTGATGTIGSTWSALSPGEKILGATYVSGSNDYVIQPLTFQQYQEEIADKSTTGDPKVWATDGYATIYFYPQPQGVTVKLRTGQVVSDFADLDTDYGMPKGFKSHLSAILAERLAPSMLGGIPPAVAKAAFGARLMLAQQTCIPAILGEPVIDFDIEAGY